MTLGRLQERSFKVGKNIFDCRRINIKQIMSLYPGEQYIHNGRKYLRTHTFVMEFFESDKIKLSYHERKMHSVDMETGFMVSVSKMGYDTQVEVIDVTQKR